MEAFARIVTSGLFLDPEIPMSLFFNNPFKPNTADTRPTMLRDSDGNLTHRHSAPVNSGLSRNDSLRSKADSNTVRFRVRAYIRQLQFNLLRPFALAHHEQWQATGPAPDMLRSHSSSSTLPVSSRSDTPFVEEKIHSSSHLVPHLRDPSKPTFFSRAL